MRRHLTFANVASATALALVLSGGVAVAAGLAPNSVGSKQIKAQAVKSSDVKNNGLRGQDIKESSLGSVPSVDTVVTTKRVTAAVGALPVVLANRGPFTFTLRCTDGGGGNTDSFLEVRTSADNASLDSTGSEEADFDVFQGPRDIASTSDNVADIERASFVATTPAGVMYQGVGYTASKLNGSSGCAAQLTFVG
jgi:hypothetical protein